MKKHRDADELAARISAAANQPPVVVATPVTVAPEAEPIQEPRRRNYGTPRAKRRAANEPEDDTVPISLRPGRGLLNRYTMAASDRTRETGRVTSAQQIMLEVLERGP